MTNDRIKSAVIELVGLLAHQRYDDVAKITRSTRLTASEIEGAVRDYGRHLVFPPEEAFEALDVVPISDSPGSYSVQMRLFTAEEGESDLSLDLTLKFGNAATVIELNDIHVL
jgi:hypothetical protein